MINIRCRCGKIVCQLDNIAEAPAPGAGEECHGPAVVILCRHCRALVVLRVAGVATVEHGWAETGPRRLISITDS